MCPLAGCGASLLPRSPMMREALLLVVVEVFRLSSVCWPSFLRTAPRDRPRVCLLSPPPPPPPPEERVPPLLAALSSDIPEECFSRTRPPPPPPRLCLVRFPLFSSALGNPPNLNYFVKHYNIQIF